MRDQSIVTTNQLIFNEMDETSLSQPFCDIDDDETSQDDETFEVETGCDADHLVLCNRRVDYQMRSPLLNDVCVYSFFSEYRKAQMTLRDKNLLQGDGQPATTISRGRPLNDRWLFRTDHPQYSSHMLIRRSFAVVPVLVGPAIPRHDREDTAERYARAILTLFHPWTTVFDICHVGQSWSEGLVMWQPTFNAESHKVISNIQLLHECKRDRDDDLFQLVNKPIVSKPTTTPQSYIDTSIEESEELLALLEASMDADQPLINQNMIQHEGSRGRISREYVDITIANVIRSERFTHGSNVGVSPELMMNNSITSSRRTTVDEVVVRQANYEDIQQNRGWQHDLKNQKDEIRRTLLFGSTEDISAVNKGCVKIRKRIKFSILERSAGWSLFGSAIQ